VPLLLDAGLVLCLAAYGDWVAILVFAGLHWRLALICGVRMPLRQGRSFFLWWSAIAGLDGLANVLESHSIRQNPYKI